ncbi:MAG: hypothetical protein H6Q72_4781 [Firmicutes bacterium]|nr:hypothetical protein [Bacillota bacterium]
MNLVDAVKRSNIAKAIKEQIIDVIGITKRDNSRKLPSYLNKEMQVLVTILRAFSLTLKDKAKALESRGYEFEADHVDLASRILAVATMDFLNALDEKERAAVERAYSNVEVTVTSTYENRIAPERFDDEKCYVDVETIYELAEMAIESECKGCQGKAVCKTKEVMLALRVPISQDGGKCPYANVIEKRVVA